MKGRYEIKDTKVSGRGNRFTSLDHARLELAHAVPAGRFVIYDREAKEVIA